MSDHWQITFFVLFSIKSRLPPNQALFHPLPLISPQKPILHFYLSRIFQSIFVSICHEFIRKLEESWMNSSWSKLICCFDNSKVCDEFIMSNTDSLYSKFHTGIPTYNTVMIKAVLINIRVEWHVWIDVWLSSSHLPLNSIENTSFFKEWNLIKVHTWINQQRICKKVAYFVCINSMTCKFKLLLNSKQLLLPVNSCNNVPFCSMLDFLWKQILGITFWHKTLFKNN